MTLADKLKQSIASQDGREIREVVEFMQFTLGWNYQRCFKAAKRCVPELELAEWDELLYLADKVGAS